jgi:hypothetical protein
MTFGSTTSARLLSPAGQGGRTRDLDTPSFGELPRACLPAEGREAKIGRHPTADAAGLAGCQFSGPDLTRHVSEYTSMGPASTPKISPLTRPSKQCTLLEMDSRSNPTYTEDQRPFAWFPLGKLLGSPLLPPPEWRNWQTRGT